MSSWQLTVRTAIDNTRLLQQSESTPPEDRALGWPTDQVSLVAGRWGFSHEKRSGQGISGLARRAWRGSERFGLGDVGDVGDWGSRGFPGRFQPVTWDSVARRKTEILGFA